MGRVEMMILVMAIAIFGRYSLTVNDALAKNEIHVLQSEYELNAVSIVEGIFRRAGLNYFDENTVSGIPRSIPDDFTAYGLLGPETGESYPDFDDIDDYNGLSLVDTADNGMTYILSVSTGYINTSDKNTFLGVRSTLKRMDVTISSEYLRNDITLSRIYPFWK